MLRRSFFCLTFLTLLLVQSQLVRGQTSGGAPQKLRLEPCRPPGWSEDVRCGRYEVFENRKTRTGRRLSLRIVVVPALAAHPAPDPVFYFMGGPGGSAVEVVQRAGKSFLAGLRSERDLVFVDQRGTGDSNRLACDLHGEHTDMASYFGDAFPSDRVRACRAELEKVADLKLYSTPIAMEDIDEVRAALGYDKINLYGGSYGSTAALVYLRQYPQHVRSVTVMGVAPPDMKLPLPFGKGVQNALERVFADCAADEACHKDFSTPMADLETAAKRLDKAPVTFTAVNPVTRQPETITLNRESFGEAIRVMLYIPAFSSWLPILLHQAAQGEFGLFATIAFQNMRLLETQISRGMHLSVVCGEDLPFISDVEAERELGGTFYGSYRFRVYRRACGLWPRADVPSSFTAPVVSDVPILLLSGDADPVTPPWLATTATKKFTNGRQIIIPHTGHYFSFTCVDQLAAEFVSKGSAKDLDASCLAQIHRPRFVNQEAVNGLARAQAATQNNVTKPALNEQLWQGVLEVGSAKLRLVLHLTQSADGKLAANLDSPDQQAMGLAIDTISRRDQSLRFEMSFIGATYEGKFNEAGTEIRGEWRQQGNSWPLTFNRADPATK